MYALKLKNKIKSINGLVTQAVKSKIGRTEAPKYLNHVREEAPKYISHVKDEVIYKKFGELNNWYTRVLGLDEVRLYQERVVSLQEKLLYVQEKRRDIGQQLTAIRKKSNELQDQIHKVKRQDDLQRFLDLMKEETEILKKEIEVTNSFNECDREEREVFTAFTNAVRDSHEKQRAQLEYTKYFGLILSLVGSFLTFCYSTLKKQDLKRFVEEHLMMATGSSKPLLIQLQENQEQLSRIVNHIDNNNPQLLSVINGNQNEIMNVLRNASLRNDREAANVLNSNSKIPNMNGLTSVPGQEKVLIYSCAAIAAFVILRAFIS